MTEATTESTKTKTPKAKAVKSPAPAREGRLTDATIISLSSDAEGKKYGSDHNPTRPGAAVHDRFAKYVDGMTVAEAKAAGITAGDIAYHVKQGFLTVSTPAAAPEAEAA